MHSCCHIWFHNRDAQEVLKPPAASRQRIQNSRLWFPDAGRMDIKAGEAVSSGDDDNDINTAKVTLSLYCNPT
jgi:hypothetical protein